MSTYEISAKPSGSKKDNAASRVISELFPYGNGSYKTISLLERRDGIWCNCGGRSQNVVLTGYDQLINTATGTVIKTSAAATCKCHGTGPASENYMTTVFDAWTQAESNAAVAAWAAGTLQIKRTVSVKSYTSPKHGTPVFRDGYYDDVIRIQGSTRPFTDYLPAVQSFSVMRSGDGISEDALSASVWARIQISMNNTAGLNDSPKLSVQVSTDAGFEDEVSSVSLGTTAAAIEPYFVLSLVQIPGNYSVGRDYYFRLVFSAGEESALSRSAAVNMAYVPFHIPGNNAGVAFGMYSNAEENQHRLESAYAAYLYGGIAQIGSGWTELTPLAGSTPAEFGGGRLRCRAVENKRIIAGSLLVQPGSEAIVLAQLPEGYAPASGVFSMNACSGSRIARIAVGGENEENAGKLCLSWVRNLGDGDLYTSAAIWVQCGIEYWVD